MEAFSEGVLLLLKPALGFNYYISFHFALKGQ